MSDTRKACTQCGEKKPLDQFAFHRGSRGNRRAACRACCCEKMREYSKENPEKRAALARKWRRENPEAYNAIMRRYRAKKRAEAQENRERSREIVRLSVARYRAKTQGEPAEAPPEPVPTPEPATPALASGRGHLGMTRIRPRTK